MALNPWTNSPTLAERYDPRNNAAPAVRLFLACALVLDHAYSLGYGRPAFGSALTSATHAQLPEFFTMCFFIISGFFVTQSAQRNSIGRYLWLRAVRILPALWVSLAVTAFLVAPVMAYLEHGSIEPWSHSLGSGFSYVYTNLFAAMSQWGMPGILNTVPYHGTEVGGNVFNGSLWSLKYELAAYVALAALTSWGVLARRPWIAVLLLLGWTAVSTLLWANAGFPTARTPTPGAIPLPLVGSLSVRFLVPLGLAFLIGSAMALYKERIPIHWSLAGAAVALMAVTQLERGFAQVGVFGAAYLTLFVIVMAPASVKRIGRVRDYSYGVFLYAFPMQQLMYLLGAAALGVFGYTVSALAAALGLAIMSWHWVERPTSGWRKLDPPRLPWQRRTGVHLPTTSPIDIRQGDSTTEAASVTPPGG